MGASSFGQIVRDEQLTAINVIRKWLQTHKAVNASCLAIETDNYYSEVSYRMAIWRMAHSGELALAPASKEGFYVAGPDLQPPEYPVSQDEIGLVALVMSTPDVAKLYGISQPTVRRYKAVYLAKNGEGVADTTKASSKYAAKLTASQVRAIREDYVTPRATLAARHGVSYTTIWNIQNGKAYAYISNTSRTKS